ncbi:MAG TPA: MFS transporter, partial [Candidatus Limnocylindria bacterium]|nr:MFS transporter [Candidatus Limnocylindria bacterium]
MIGPRLRHFAGGYRGFSRNARIFVSGSFLSSAAFGLFFVNFNLYLAARGLDPATIGLVATTSGLSIAAAAIPASILANRFGSRRTMLLGASGVIAALIGFLILDTLAAIFALIVLYGASQQLLSIPAAPFLTENSAPEQRNEVFALNGAAFNLSQVIAGLSAGAIVGLFLGGGSTNPVASFHVLLGGMLLLICATTVLIFTLHDDHRGATKGQTAVIPPEPNQAPVAAYGVRARLSRIGIHVGDARLFLKLVAPGFLVAIGAGQVLPFLNLYIVGRFGLDLSTTNAVFAVSALGTMIAILIQPVIARRYGKIQSVVLVQAASIPFIVVLGFAPWIPLVIVGMTVRNALMNAANPVFSAYVMGRVRPLERATLSASQSMVWSIGWAVGGIYYSSVQSAFGFARGYDINFLTIIAFYTTATALYYVWFARPER